MSDDFNELRPPEGDDDNWLDWQADDDAEQSAASSGDRLGFTGELSWRQDVEKAFSDQLDEANDDAFDWQPDTGTDAPQPDDDVPDWLAAFTGDEPAESEPAVDLPPWLSQFGETEPEDEAAAPAPLGDVPAWLREDSEDLPGQPVEPAPGLETPPWLSQFGEAEPEDEAAAAMPAADVPAWLREDSEDAPAADLPPWLSGADEPEAAETPAIPGGDVPPWLAGLDEPAAPVEDDDLFAGLDEALGIAPGSASAGETPDWMGAFEEPAAAEAPPSGLDAYLVEEVVDETFFDEPPADEGVVPDWLMAAAPDTEAAEPAAGEPLAGDLFSGWMAAPEPEEVEEVEELPAPSDELFPDWMSAPDETEAEEAPDLLTGWEAARQALDTADEELAADEGVPDWLAAAAPPSEPATVPQDIFGELGLPSPETGFDFLDNPPVEAETPDWFEPEAAASAEPGWLGELGELDLSSAAETETAVPAEADFLAELRGAADLTADVEPPPAPDYDLSPPSFDDLDSLIASYEAPEATPEYRALVDTRIDDIERLLSDEDIGEIAARRAPRVEAGDISPETPDWLTESGVLVGGASAGAILRRQTERERPLEELDERLQALHDRGLDLPPPVEEAPSPDLKTLLPGVKEFIAPTPIKAGTTGIAGEVMLSPQQMDKLKLLRLLAPAEAPPQPQVPSALDQTYAAPSFADLVGEEEELEEAVEPVPAPRRERRRIQFDRLLIVLLVALAVVLPFFVGVLRVGDLPPAQFAANSRQQAVFDRVNALAPGDLVLVAAEYGPTGAAELDGLTEALLRHMLLKGARPVIISTNPLGLLHVQHILDRLTADAVFTVQLNRPLAANRDFYVARYLTGSVIGLRAFAQNVPALLATDISGRATNLATASLRDFALIVTIAERAEDVRAWAEQVAPLAGKPLSVAVGFAAAPLAEPYVQPNSPEKMGGIRGLLVGYRDAYTYRAQLGVVDAVALGSIPTQPPAVLPTVPPASPAPADQDETAVEATAEAAGTVETTPEAPAEATAEAAATAEATDTPLVIFGVIDADQTVNVREGPARVFRAVAAARPGDRVQIIGRSGDGDWLQIRLADGREGWISSGLVRVEEPATPTPDAGAGLDPYAVVALESDVRWVAFQVTPTPAAESTAEPAAPPFDAADVVTGTPTPYRDERWYGMTLGLIVIIAVIATGTVINVIGSLFRRRGR